MSLKTPACIIHKDNPTTAISENIFRDCLLCSECLKSGEWPRVLTFASILKNIETLEIQSEKLQTWKVYEECSAILFSKDETLATVNQYLDEQKSKVDNFFDEILLRIQKMVTGIREEIKDTIQANIQIFEENFQVFQSSFNRQLNIC